MYGTIRVSDRIYNPIEHLRILFDNLDETVFLAPLSKDGVHGNFIEVNDVACKRLGYSREELLHMNARTINPLANRDKVKSFGRQIRREGTRLFEAIHEMAPKYRWGWSQKPSR